MRNPATERRMSMDVKAVGAAVLAAPLIICPNTLRRETRV